jgi:hypothetical protein
MAGVRRLGITFLHKAGSSAVEHELDFRGLMRSIATFPHRVQGDCTVSSTTPLLITLKLSLMHGVNQHEEGGRSLWSKGSEQ